MILRFIKTYGIGNIQFLKFIKYNYFCRVVKRIGKGKIVPFKKSVLTLDKEAVVELNGPLLLNKNGFGKKQSTSMKVEKNGKVEVNQDFTFCYGCDVIVMIIQDSKLGAGPLSRAHLTHSSLFSNVMPPLEVRNRQILQIHP